MKGQDFPSKCLVLLNRESERMHDLLQRLESLDVETRRVDFARIESEEESLRGLLNRLLRRPVS